MLAVRMIRLSYCRVLFGSLLSVCVCVCDCFVLQSFVQFHNYSRGSFCKHHLLIKNEKRGNMFAKGKRIVVKGVMGAQEA